MAQSPPPYRPHTDQSYSILSLQDTLYLQTQASTFLSISEFPGRVSKAQVHKEDMQMAGEQRGVVKHRLTVRWLCSTWWRSLREWRTPRWRCGCFLFLCQCKAICSGRAGGSMWSCKRRSGPIKTRLFIISWFNPIKESPSSLIMPVQLEGVASD